MGGPALATVGAAVTALEQSADMSELCTIVRRFAGPFGYDSFALYSSPPSRGEAVDHVYWLEGDWFGDGDPVDPKTYLARCPVNRHVLETDRPFLWTKSGGREQETYRVVTRPRGPGVHGYQVPVFGMTGLVGAMSFGGSVIDSSVDVRLALNLIATTASHVVRRITASGAPIAQPRLSKRELEVMRWVTSGRRQSDVALLLGLSERTVENHMRRIRKRLGVASTAQAIGQLIQSGDLEVLSPR
ncbi:PA1136 family autoinducer-binding transcriptional regulator [Paracoccus thiocyanatus]|uniref:LuxR family transcriptional regulator n=1 Tax=Paracoccus thiocyanatus TaxID=34006 RepID=A0A3D8PDH1_9RHOB|nr:PA1136 family autoinducer-binding transcriptional regulator [Paracoccus thiocyanatus]RDW14110.1 LuxR family transcriptional regulator [Paracoccus thiocyanatus]